ncbi:MAG: hypothetical protein ABSE41_15605 [Bacteroidota bacterium]|jgi:hypothetical protein
MRRSIASIVTVLMLSGQFRAEAQEHQFSFALRGAYTTTSKTYTNPDSPSADLRGQYTGIDNIYAPGFEIRWMVPGNSIAISLAAEYLSKFDEEMELVGFLNPPRALPVKEGLRLVPIELGGLVFVPLGSDKVRLTMGGGLGMYIGRRYLTIAGVEASQQNKPVSFGIHVETSFDYRVTPGLFARLDMRFRDPEYTTESRFQQEATQYGGILVLLPRDPFRAKINVNGLNFGLGVGFEVF